MKSSIIKIARYVAFLILGIALLFFAYKNVDFSEMKEILVSAKYSWVFLSLLFSIFAFISRARRWVLLIEPLGKKPGLWNTYNALLFGYLANYAFPRMGEVTRCIALNRKSAVPVDSLLGTVVIERAIDFLSLIVIIFLLLIARFEKFGAFFKEDILSGLTERSDKLLESKLLVILVILGLFIFIILAVIIFRKQLSGLKIVAKFKGVFKNLGEGLQSIRHMERKWEFIFHTVFIWTNYALMTWVVVFALPDITGEFKFADGLFLLVIGSLGMAAPVNAGIGAFHYIVSRGLMVVYGLGETEGQAFASLQHTSQTLLVFLLGSIASIFLFTGKHKAKANENEEPA